MGGIVRGLYVFRERGKPGEPVKQARFLKDQGMEGDRHADGGSRQLTLMAGEVRDWMQAQPSPGLCFRRYKANLETEGLDIRNLCPGQVLQAGTAQLQVSETGKECFAECPLFQAGSQCRLSQGAVFLTVRQSGIISERDQITIGGVVS